MLLIVQVLVLVGSTVNLDIGLDLDDGWVKASRTMFRVKVAMLIKVYFLRI